MNPKDLLFVGVLLFVTLNLSAQTLSPRFGIKAGLSLSYATVNDARGTDSKTGFHIGGTFEYPLSPRFLIQSGLLFSTKGSQVHVLNGSHYIPSPPDDTHTFNESYLMLPLYGAYKLNLTSDFNITFGIGPYLGYGIGGKTKQKLNSGSWSDGITEIQWDTFGNGIYDESRDWLRGTTLKRTDIGLGANIDFEYRRFILSVGYEKGLRNIAAQENTHGLSYRNNTGQASIGYKL
ncbi:porin family protein [Parapedobacter sp. GCM10030251]|uniref:porin family protein n=1 Tax=Parapedobacter sp. GCM10030251 TaxID=3273419 RepID=UPI003608F2F6